MEKLMVDNNKITWVQPKVGPLIKLFREQRGLSQTDVSIMVNANSKIQTSKQTIYRLEVSRDELSSEFIKVYSIIFELSFLCKKKLYEVAEVYFDAEEAISKIESHLKLFGTFDKMDKRLREALFEFYKNKNYEVVIDLLKKDLIQLEDPDEKKDCVKLLANVYLEKGIKEKSIETILQGIKKLKTIKNQEDLVLAEIAQMYLLLFRESTGDFLKEAIDYFTEALSQTNHNVSLGKIIEWRLKLSWLSQYSKKDQRFGKVIKVGIKDEIGKHKVEWLNKYNEKEREFLESIINS